MRPHSMCRARERLFGGHLGAWVEGMQVGREPRTTPRWCAHHRGEASLGWMAQATATSVVTVVVPASCTYARKSASSRP